VKIWNKRLVISGGEMDTFDLENLSEMKVLMVDDAPENLDILGHMLTSLGVTISVATSGETALEVVKNNRPDLILLDVMMPGMSGYEVCERLKRDINTKDIPVIFITAKMESQDILKGFSAGGVDYITKPFREMELLARVNIHLKVRRAHDEIIRREKFYQVIMESVPDLIFQLDPDRKIVFANPAFRLLGYDPDQLVGRPIINLIESNDKENLLESLATKYTGPLAITNLEVNFKVSDDVALVEEMSGRKCFVDCVGLWNVPDEEVFKNNVDKTFLGTLCVAKIRA
jgi:PAS domain S-box-containing protein